MTDEIIINDRMNKVKSWILNPYNLILVCILILGIFIRIYLFLKTSGQSGWYDEMDYMATAKHWAFDIPYNLNVHRPPLFQYLGALMFMFGANELIIKFLLVLIPSSLLIVVIYLLGKEMYSREVGLVAAFMTSVSWTLLFWTVRFQPDFISLLFQVSAVLFMWKYWKTNSSKFIIWAGIFSALGFLFKVSGLLIPLAFIIFILLKERWAAIKNKCYYYYSLAFLITLLPYFIWSYMTFNTPFSFASGYGASTSAALGWYILRFLYMLIDPVTFCILVIGIFLAFKFILYIDLLVKDKTKCFNANLFTLVIMGIVAAFYIFWMKGAEDRWLFLWLPFMFFLIGTVFQYCYNYSKKNIKVLLMIIVVGILLFGGYSQINAGSKLINDKKDTYMPLKESGLFIKQYSNTSDKILSASYPQTSYYSEREVILYSEVNNSQEFEELINRTNPRFLIISIYEYHPQFVYTWPNENNTIVVNGYTDPINNNQPSLIIYELKSWDPQRR